MAAKEDAEKLISLQISRVLDECRLSYAIHSRKLKELSAIRSSSSIPRFFPAFAKTLKPLFDFPRKSPSVERIVRFVSIFAAHRDEKNAADCDAFLEEFLRFLLTATVAANKTARSRSCQIISEIIMRLPDDAEVSNELWDDVIDCMLRRVEDKVPSVRTFAVRALARFANDSENADIINQFLHALLHEQNAEVRKTIVLSMPPSNLTSAAVIERTLDVSESVRKAAYCVLANKFPLQSLSIKLRTIILQRGLTDRSSAVMKECFKLMKDEWLMKSCNGDPVLLLKFLDVETYESVGEAVMEALLKARMVHVQAGQSMREYLGSISETDAVSGHSTQGIQLMEAEVALYWRTLCKHLQVEAQIKGSDAAATAGTEAAVYAAEANDNNDLLERVLPSTVSDYIELVKAHLAAGPNYRFASRQLLLLGTMLDFSDSTNRKVASAFVHELLNRPLEHEVDDDGNKVVIGDGINLGGDGDWAKAVSELAKKVHASVGEFEEVVTCVVEELARPCRERAADFMQWMHCLSVTGLLLENVKSIRCLQGKAIEPLELLHSILLPGAKHVHIDVQRVAIRCLGLFGLVERKPSEQLVKQLRLSVISGSSPVRIMASKALVDLGMWHGPEEVDRAVGLDLPHSPDGKKKFSMVDLSDANSVQNVELLDLLYSRLDIEDCDDCSEIDDYETDHAILGEGFAKILLLSENYPSIPVSLHPLLFSRLINLYFSNESKDMHRLKQCLSVFFEHCPALSADHKKCISKAFIPVMRSLWPGIYGNSGGAPVVVSAQRKRAIQASRFMLQMMQTPLYPKGSQDDHLNDGTPQTPDGSVQSLIDIESGEEGLAIRIATEVASCPIKKTAAGRSYIMALCKIAPLLHFRPSEQVAIKCMRGLICHMVESVSTDKELVKELMQMNMHLKALHDNPDEEFSQDQANLIFGKLELDVNLDADISTTMPPTPVPRSTRAPQTRKRTRRREVSSDDEETSPVSVVPMTPSLVSGRSQRASKTVAMTRISSRKAALDTDDDNEGESDVTSEEASSSDDSADGIGE